MASSSASLHFLPSPSSKTLYALSQTIFPTSLHLFSSFHKPFFSTSSKLFEVTPSSRVATRIAVSPDLELDDDLSSGVDDELDQGSSHELKLFVGNLPFHVDNAALAMLFQQSGNVELVEVVYDKLNRRSRGFGFVKMSSTKEAEEAAKRFDGYELDGRQLRVNYGPPPRKMSFVKELRDDDGSNNNNNTVYVGNLSWNIDNEALETLFWEHGNVLQAKVFYDKYSGRSRGFGFVTYSSAHEVSSAVESLDGVLAD